MRRRDARCEIWGMLALAQGLRPATWDALFELEWQQIKRIPLGARS
jgi:hypothetical protein